MSMVECIKHFVDIIVFGFYKFSQPSTIIIKPHSFQLLYHRKPGLILLRGCLINVAAGSGLLIVFYCNKYYEMMLLQYNSPSLGT